MHGRDALASLLGLALGAGLGCSNVDRTELDECRDDTDCGTGLVCSLAQGNTCVPEALPPQDVLGFEIRNSKAARIELTGCDPEVSRELGGSELRVQSPASIMRDFSLRVSEVRSVVNCGGDECAGECDEEALTCTEPKDAQLRLSMRSRLGLDAPYSQKPYLTEPPDAEPLTPAAFTWPSYESSDEKAHAALQLQVTPPVEEPTRSRFLRVIAEGAPDELEASALSRCQRAIIGGEGMVHVYNGGPVADAAIEFFYNEPIATTGTVLGGQAAPCVDEGDCLPGWACNVEQGRCGLDLTGVSAGSTTSLADPPGAFPPAYLYTYCEGIVAPVDPLTRQFLVTVRPPAETGLPEVSYELAQDFIDPPQPGTLTELNIETALCLPDWQPPMPVGFSVAGEPVPLTETDLGVYSCCSTECLPSTEPDVEPTPPPTVESCHDFKRVRFETHWFNTEDAWLFGDPPCTPTAVANSDGSSGEFVRDITECDEEGCTAMLTIGEAIEDSRNYTVMIEQPAGSVFRSQRFNVALTPETTELPTFELEPRVLLRGQVVCADTNCSAENAIVAAERLRTETDGSDLPGPFYFDTGVDAEGNFILPLDPGVYVITAYPAVGQPGAPSPFVYLDLREDSAQVSETDGVPHAALEDPLELDEGVLVRVLLRDFEVSTSVVPLDIGSWTYQSDFPEEIDLNDPETCLGSSTRGCQIRRMRPTEAAISLLISRRFQFTARKRGSDKCPE
jgi:hypothetical protein